MRSRLYLIAEDTDVFRILLCQPRGRFQANLVIARIPKVVRIRQADSWYIQYKTNYIAYHPIPHFLSCLSLYRLLTMRRCQPDREYHNHTGACRQKENGEGDREPCMHGRQRVHTTQDYLPHSNSALCDRGALHAEGESSMPASTSPTPFDGYIQ